MKRRYFVVATCVVFWTGPAHAEDLKGRLGVGSDTTLGGIAGVSTRYGVHRDISVQGILAAGLFSPSSGDSETRLSLGLGAIYDIYTADELTLGARAGIDVGFLSPTTGDSATQVSFSTGLRPEYFITRFFSMHVQLGFVLELIPEEGRVLPPDGESDAARNEGTNFALNVDLLGTAGFTFWF